MTYNFNGNILVIPDKELDKNIELLELTQEEAIQMWLEDNGYLDNEEQAALDEKAKKVKISREATSVNTKPKKHTVKISDEKKALFDSILANLDRCEGVTRENIEVLRENKLISVQIGAKIFKIDIIETRTKPKAT